MLYIFILLILFYSGCYSTEVVTGANQDVGVNVQNCIRYPIAYLPSDREVIPGQTIFLKLMLHPAVCADEVIGYEWSQVSGPSIYLTNNGSDNTSFIVPPEYKDIILSVKIKGRQYTYEDTLTFRVVDRISHWAPLADAGGDVSLPPGYSHRVDAYYSQGKNRANMKYLWMTIPDSNPLLSISSKESFETTLVVNDIFDIPQIVLLEVIEDGLRSTRDIKLIHPNTESHSVVMAPRLEPEASEINAQTDSKVELRFKNVDKYKIAETYWFQLSGNRVELSNIYGGVEFITSDMVDNLTFAAFAKIDNLYTPPTFFKVRVGGSSGVALPVADAGADQKVKTLSEVRLNGSKSTVSYPRKITYRWRQVYGSTVSLKDADKPFPYFTAPRLIGKLVFQLTVNDGYITSQPDTVIIDVTNE
ncbi:MAG: PKD domain-containing protein [Myxococcota bacterium]